MTFDPKAIFQRSDRYEGVRPIIRMGCQPSAACVASAIRSPAPFFAQKNLPIVLDTPTR